MQMLMLALLAVCAAAPPLGQPLSRAAGLNQGGGGAAHVPLPLSALRCLKQKHKAQAVCLSTSG